MKILNSPSERIAFSMKVQRHLLDELDLMYYTIYNYTDIFKFVADGDEKLYKRLLGRNSIPRMTKAEFFEDVYQHGANNTEPLYLIGDVKLHRRCC